MLYSEPDGISPYNSLFARHYTFQNRLSSYTGFANPFVSLYSCSAFPFVQ